MGLPASATYCPTRAPDGSRGEGGQWMEIMENGEGFGSDHKHDSQIHDIGVGRTGDDQII